MSQIAVQKEKQLTFEEICPEWSAFCMAIWRAKTHMDIIEAEIDHPECYYTDGRRCFVGEAHGWSRDYTDTASERYCDECSKLAVSGLCHYAVAATNEDSRAKFENAKTRLVTHWNAVHNR